MFQGCSSNENSNLILLSGEWQFKMDSLDVGVSEAWHTKDFDDFIRLPGSMMKHDKGFEPTCKPSGPPQFMTAHSIMMSSMQNSVNWATLSFPFGFTPPKHYVGAAWFRRDITIHERWSNKKMELNLERPHWETTIWVDSIQAGPSQRSLSTPHKYDLCG